MQELDQLLAELELGVDLFQLEVVELVEQAEMDPMEELQEQKVEDQWVTVRLEFQSPLQSLELFENQLGFEE